MKRVFLLIVCSICITSCNLGSITGNATDGVIKSVQKNKDSIIALTNEVIRTNTNILRDSLLSNVTRNKIMEISDSLRLPWLNHIDGIINKSMDKSILTVDQIKNNLLNDDTRNRLNIIREDLLGQATANDIAAMRDTLIGNETRRQINLISGDIFSQLFAYKDSINITVNSQRNNLNRDIILLLWTIGLIAIIVIGISTFLYIKVLQYRKTISLLKIKMRPRDLGDVDVHEIIEGINTSIKFNIIKNDIIKL